VRNPEDAPQKKNKTKEKYHRQKDEKKAAAS
jgi:hypothetical protein